MIFYSLVYRSFNMNINQYLKLICKLRLPLNSFSNRSFKTVFSNIYCQKLFFSFLKKSEQKKDIDLLMRLKVLRGWYHLFCLPVRGQRSKTNARTQRLKKKV